VVFRADPNASPDDRVEFATSATFAELQAEFEPTFSITFSEISRVYGKPITGVLTQMRDLVEGILLAFERRFFP
jgi:hypothetical protein